jgi:hypothetical protein
MNNKSYMAVTSIVNDDLTRELYKDIFGKNVTSSRDGEIVAFGIHKAIRGDCGVCLSIFWRGDNTGNITDEELDSLWDEIHPQVMKRVYRRLEKLSKKK